MFPAVLLTATAWDVSHGVGEGGAVVSRGFGVCGAAACGEPRSAFTEDRGSGLRGPRGRVVKFLWLALRCLPTEPMARGLCPKLPCFGLQPRGDVRGLSCLAPQGSLG